MIAPSDRAPIPEEALNAYIDGELTADEAAQIAQAAAADPRIAALIAQLHQLKAGVAGIGAEFVMLDLPLPLASPQPRPQPRRRWAAVAALALLALSLGWLLQMDSAPAPLRIAAAQDPAPLQAFVQRHDGWIRQGEQNGAESSTAHWLEPLMRETGLALVRDLPLQDAPDTRHFAFVGPNGCRLSLFETRAPGAPEPLLVSVTDGLLSARWSGAGQSYALIARTMDSTRFSIIAAGVHGASLRAGSVDALAIASLQQARQPCLG